MTLPGLPPSGGGIMVRARNYALNLPAEARDCHSLRAELTPHAGGAAAQFVRYRCRKCRRLLATERNVVEVEAGAGPGAFSWRKRDRWPGRSGGGASLCRLSSWRVSDEMDIAPSLWQAAYDIRKYTELCEVVLRSVYLITLCQQIVEACSLRASLDALSPPRLAVQMAQQPLASRRSRDSGYSPSSGWTAS